MQASSLLLHYIKDVMTAEEARSVLKEIPPEEAEDYQGRLICVGRRSASVRALHASDLDPVLSPIFVMLAERAGYHLMSWART